MSDAALPFATRDVLHLIATHLLSRVQHAANGRIGLRITPGGFATGFVGAGARVRVSGGLLVLESEAKPATSTQARPLDGATLAELAEFVGADLDAPFSAGHDTPPLGDTATPLVVDASAAMAIVDWFGDAARALDLVVSSAAGSSPALAQLWPEHFDLGVDLAFDLDHPTDRRVNLGASAGDGFHAEPYLYVGPWTSDRPGDAAFWNAPFGAVLGSQEIDVDDRIRAMVRFFATGLEMLSA